MAVVKADGYGHGDRQVAQVFQREGANWFAVSNIEEAMHLRQGGITKPVLILGFTPADRAAQLCANRISQTVFSLDYAKALSEQAQKAGVEVDCHIKLDTGMSRLGFLCDPAHFSQSIEQIGETVALPGLACTGIFTHLPVLTRPMRIPTGLRWNSLAVIKKGCGNWKKGRPFFAASLLQQRRYHAFSPNASGYGAPRCDFVRPESYARLRRADGSCSCHGFKIHCRHGKAGGTGRPGELWEDLYSV